MVYKVVNILCVQPEYCKANAPEDFCDPETCKDCDKAGDNVSQDSVVETNRELLLQRSNVGIQKYGTTLEKSNLSEEAILQHALEEALDLANYLQTRLMQIRGAK